MTRVIARLRRRLTFANVTAALALFVAMGGTSYAAIVLPADSVGSAQIRYHAVGHSEIRPNAVRAWQIDRDAVGRSEIRPNAVRAWEINRDAVGPSEIRRGAVRTDEIAADAVAADQIKDGSVGMTKLDDATRNAIASGPLTAAVTSAGAVAGGDAKTVSRTDNAYTVDFGTDVSKCVATATPATHSDTDAATDGASATVAPGSAVTAIVVKTFGGDGTAAQEPFNVILGC